MFDASCLLAGEPLSKPNAKVDRKTFESLLS